MRRYRAPDSDKAPNRLAVEALPLHAAHFASVSWMIQRKNHRTTTGEL
jgi:hypothetical protein